MDYIFPTFISKALRRPSQRTQLESSLVGITFMMLSSFFTAIYLLFFVKVGWAYGTLIVFSEIGVIFFMGSMLVTNYIQYYVFKKTMGLYPPDEELNMKLEEAKLIILELSDLVEKNKSIEMIDEDTGKKIVGEKNV